MMSRAVAARYAPAWLGATIALLGKSQSYLPALAAVVSVTLALPALGVGLILDDYYHRAILMGVSRYRELIGPPAEMFCFFRGDPARTGQIVDLGLFPWWTDLSLKAEFLQALTVLTHRLDYLLWPNSPVLMHAHSLAWLGVAAAAAAAVYRRLLGATWVAAVAALLFAADDARGATVGFIANRNALIAASFGFSALVFHDRWRRQGSRGSAVMAVVLLAAALFAKEEGIGTCAYLAAYALCLDRGPWFRAGMTMVPYVLVVVVWRSLRDHWGYGVQNLGLYIDPITDPGPFTAAIGTRIPLLLLGQLSPIPAESAVLTNPTQFAALLAVAVGFLCLLAFALAPLLARDRTARFWGLGMVLATVPLAATLPGDRLLTFVGLGAAGLLAQFWTFVFGAASFSDYRPGWRTVALPLAWFLIAVHAIIGPLLLPLRAGNPIGPSAVERRFYVGSNVLSQAEGRTVIIVNAPSVPHVGYSLLIQEQAGNPVPRHLRALAPAVPAVIVRRVDDHTLAIRPQGGYLRWPLDRVFRNKRRPLAAGDQVRLSGMSATVASVTEDGRPLEAVFQFDSPLDDPDFLWLCFRDGAFRPFTPPAPGQEIEIPFHWKDVLFGSTP